MGKNIINVAVCFFLYNRGGRRLCVFGGRDSATEYVGVIVRVMG